MTSQTTHPPYVAEPARKYESGYRYLSLYTSPRLFSEEEYLHVEREAESKSEYVDGAIYAMSGGSFVHAALISRIGELIMRKRGSKDCGVYFSDLRLHVQGHRSYFYPDVLMICGKPEFIDSRTDTVTNPVLLVEVLSPSTQRVDEELKTEKYQLIDSLRWYMMIHQDTMRVVLYARGNGEQWQYHEYYQGEGSVGECMRIDILESEISLAEIYEGILE